MVGGLAATISAALALGLLIMPRLDAKGLPSPDRLGGTRAVLVSSGDIEGRFVLDQPLQGFVGDTNSGTADRIDIGVAYSGSSSGLAIMAMKAGQGMEISGEALQLEIVLNGHAFVADPAACTMVLHELRYVVLRPMPAVAAGPPRGVPLPSFSGRIECIDLQGAESDWRVDLVGVFRWSPEDGWT